jgi:hypothetical protein
MNSTIKPFGVYNRTIAIYCEVRAKGNKVREGVGHLKLKQCNEIFGRKHIRKPVSAPGSLQSA